MRVTKSFLLVISAALRAMQSSKKGTTFATKSLNSSRSPNCTNAICSFTCNWVVRFKLSVIYSRMYSSSRRTTFRVRTPYSEERKRAASSLVKVCGKRISLSIHRVSLASAKRQERIVRLNECALSAPNSPRSFSTKSLLANLSK